MTASLPEQHREVRLASRPTGPIDSRHFAVVQAPLPRPGPGQVLVRNTLMSVTAAMDTLARGARGIPLPPFTPGAVLSGPALGTVVSASDGPFAPGDLVSHRAGWREYAAVDQDSVQRVAPDALPDAAAHLSQGFTAWLGVRHGVEVRPGDTVFVTAAAGGVGSLAGQFARLHGAQRVIGSTSSRAKADRLVAELGYDDVVIRGAGPVEEQLRSAAPDGIDAMFDNVGGEQLLAGLAVARRRARVALVGSMAAQVTGAATAPVEIDSMSLLARGITLRGVTGVDHVDLFPEWYQEFGRALRAGELVFPHVRYSGLAEAPRALSDLLAGRHVGAVLVEI